jgi:hypothetical protein
MSRRLVTLILDAIVDILICLAQAGGSNALV